MKEARLERSVLFLGVRNDIPELVANFDVFILPSLWEGMPRSIIEAMVLAKPVIAYDIAGIREIVDDGTNGFVVPVHDSVQMCHMIEYLLSHKSECKKLATRAKRTAKQYDFNKVVSRVERIYKHLFLQLALQ